MEDIVLNTNFWDCECEKDFIHSIAETECEKCFAQEDEQPHSRQSEIDKIGTNGNGELNENN